MTDKLLRVLRLWYKRLASPEEIPPYLRSRVREPLTNLLTRVISSEVGIQYKTTSELREYARSNPNASFWPYDTEREYTFVPPGTHSIVPERITEAIGERTFPQPYVAELSDCLLVGPRPVVRADDGQFLLDSAVGKVNLLARGLADSFLGGTNPLKQYGSVRTLDTAALLAGPLAQHYPHWYHDYLTRIEAVEQYTTRTGRSPPLIVPADLPEWMVESLSMLGYDEEDLIPWESGTTRVNRLVVPSIRQDREVLSAYADRYICRTGYEYSAHIRERARGTPSADFSDRVLITRDDVATRRMVNRPAVTSLLSKYGFKSYTLSDLPWPEQVQLFAGADTVVGVHGAGLVNMIYAASDISVVEIFGTHVTPGYYSLSNVLGYDYYSLQCDPVAQDVDVEISELEKIVSNL